MGFWDTARRVAFGGLGQGPDPRNSTFGDRDFILETAQGGIGDARGRQAPQAGRTTIGQVVMGQGPNMAQLNDVRAREMALADSLGRVASGQEMGAGELAARRAGTAATSQAIGAGMMARGPGAAGGARAAARAAAQIGLGTAGNAAGAALSDQSAARGQLAQVLGQTGGRDLGVAGLGQQLNLANMDAANRRVFEQAGLDQATTLANMQARLQTMGMNDAAILGYLGQITGMNAAELQARLAQEQASMSQGGLLGTVLSAGGQILGRTQGPAQ